MKAVFCTRYGPPDTLQLREVDKPAPRENEALVAVHASSVNYNNLGHVTGKPFLARLGFGLARPRLRTPGGDVAGRVEAVGKNVKQFHPGDEVFGDIFSAYGFGAWAEYVCVPESLLALKPANLSFEETAAVPQAAAHVALQALRDQGRIKPGQNVLIYGASGGIGHFAVQIAKAFGAEVTGVCSTRNLDMVRSLGADHVIDYTKEDFTRSGQLYSLIVATAGYRSIFDYRRALAPTGTYVCTGGSMRGPHAMAQVYQALLVAPFLSRRGGKRMGIMTARPSQADLVSVKELIEAGKVRPVVDRRYPMEDVAAALRYYGEGHARGKVVISVRDGDRFRVIGA